MGRRFWIALLPGFISYDKFSTNLLYSAHKGKDIQEQEVVVMVAAVGFAISVRELM